MALTKYTKVSEVVEARGFIRENRKQWVASVKDVIESCLIQGAIAQRDNNQSMLDDWTEQLMLLGEDIKMSAKSDYTSLGIYLSKFGVAVEKDGQGWIVTGADYSTYLADKTATSDWIKKLRLASWDKQSAGTTPVFKFSASLERLVKSANKADNHATLDCAERELVEFLEAYAKTGSVGEAYADTQEVIGLPEPGVMLTTNITTVVAA